MSPVLGRCPRAAAPGRAGSGRAASARVNMPFHSASKSLVAPTSASSSEAGHIGAWLLAQPTLVAPAVAQRDRGPAVREQQVVRDRHRVEHQGPARRVHADGVAHHHHDVGLVDRDPVLDPVGEPLADDRGVLGEPVDGLAVQPAALVLERLRQVPVVERHHRLRRRWRAARRSAGRRTPRPSSLTVPAGRAGSAATTSTAGSRRRRAASSARRPRRTGGSGRTRPPRSSRRRSGRARRRRCPRCWALAVLGRRTLDLVDAVLVPNRKPGGSWGKDPGGSVGHAGRYRHGSDRVRRMAPTVPHPRGGPLHAALVLVRAALRPRQRRLRSAGVPRRPPPRSPAAASTTTRTATSRSSPGCSRGSLQHTDSTGHTGAVGAGHGAGAVAPARASGTPRSPTPRRVRPASCRRGCAPTSPAAAGVPRAGGRPRRVRPGAGRRRVASRSYDGRVPAVARLAPGTPSPSPTSRCSTCLRGDRSRSTLARPLCRTATRSGSPTSPGWVVTAAVHTELLVWTFR